MSGGTPWTAGPWSTNGHREVLTQKGRTVCRAHLDSGTRNEDETFANARLIAAAPEMADMIAKNLATMGVTRMRLVEYGKPTSELDLAIEQTRALLTKIGASQ